MQSAYTLGPLLQCKHFNVRRLERYLWKLVYATIFFLFLPSISWTLKYLSQNFELIKKKFRVRHLQNSSLQAEILKKNNPKFQVSSASQEALSRYISYQCYTSAGLEWATCSVYYTLVAHWGYHYPILNVTVSAPSASGYYENYVIYRATWLAAQT